METIVERLKTLDRAISTHEFARLIGMRPWTIRAWVRSRRLIAHKLGNQWKIDLADAIEFWEKRASGK